MVYPFIQTVTAGTISSNIVVVETNYSPYLGQLDQVTTFTGLFDAYRIMKVDFTFIPRGNVNDLGATAGVKNGLLYTAYDYDDTGSLSTIAAISQYQSLVVSSGTAPIKRTLMPRVANESYVSGITTSYAEAKHGQWMDCAVTNTPHYGLRTMISATGTAGDVNYDVIMKFYLEFKTVR